MRRAAGILSGLLILALSPICAYSEPRPNSTGALSPFVGNTAMAKDYSGCIMVTFAPIPDGSQQTLVIVQNNCGITLPVVTVGLKWIAADGSRVNESTLPCIQTFQPGEKSMIAESNWTGPDGAMAKMAVREISVSVAVVGGE